MSGGKKRNGKNHRAEREMKKKALRDSRQVRKKINQSYRTPGVGYSPLPKPRWMRRRKRRRRERKDGEGTGKGRKKEEEST